MPNPRVAPVLTLDEVRGWWQEIVIGSSGYHREVRIERVTRLVQHAMRIRAEERRQRSRRKSIPAERPYSELAVQAADDLESILGPAHPLVDQAIELATSIDEIAPTTRKRHYWEFLRAVRSEFSKAARFELRAREWFLPINGWDSKPEPEQKVPEVVQRHVRDAARDLEETLGTEHALTRQAKALRLAPTVAGLERLQDALWQLPNDERSKIVGTES